MCWNVRCVSGQSNTYSSLSCYPSNKTHLTIQMIFFSFGGGGTGGVQDKSFKELNSHINWVCSCFLTLLFLSVEKLEFPFFLVAESLKLILSCWLELTQLALTLNKPNAKKNIPLPVGPYKWPLVLFGRETNWYLVLWTFFCPSAHYTDWCQA